MKLLLDANVCIASIKGSSGQVRKRPEYHTKRQAQILTSSIVVFELKYGVAKSREDRQPDNARILQAFLSSPISVLDFDSADAEIAGRIRADLSAAGKSVGSYDLLLAGQAVCKGLTLVTANVSECSRVTDLKFQDWSTQSVWLVKLTR